MNRNQFQYAARQFRAGRMDLNDFTDQVLAGLGPTSADPDIPGVSLDVDRYERCGYPEVIYGEGKSDETIVRIARALIDRQQNVLVTRIPADTGETLQKEWSDGVHNEVGRVFRLNRFPWTHENRETSGSVSVVTAGTADLPVAEEAVETLRWMGIEPSLVTDVGVAGPHRLPEHVDLLRASKAVIVVAGAEGALPSMVAGHVACPVIATPTSVGYGAHLGGIAALLSMLNSCAANVVVVNIDAGFKAAFVAGLIANRTAES